MTDEDRAAYRKRRMAELLAEAEADVTRTRAAKQEPATEAGPVVEVKRSKWLTNLVGIIILLALSFVLIATSMTIGRFTGHDFADARRTGTATVEQCERRGPISLDGFGYYDQCTVTIAWNNGPSSRVLIDKPGFFKGEKPGDTLQIGEHTGSRGSIGYSRPELPDRGWVTAIGIALWIIGALPLMAVLFYLREIFRDLIRRQT
ncbi:hypothetical protein BJ973_004014 [Actinoplanes tereljensis]|uniref:Uncharacterized protein n=1 Tax=Paractinoplanes tereljensis TaxID=571912 RepID=A0A919NXL2_9ACTN|nr:DUF6346 domain-containing protein [Actinoplanes tereljensis]GIF25739.1 hypothetical protein Ate02nite_84690 [Actinoplanes tereljensis]